MTGGNIVDKAETIDGQLKKYIDTYMTSWTALSWYIGMETAFHTKYMKTNVQIFKMRIFNFHNIIRKCIILTSE